MSARNPEQLEQFHKSKRMIYALLEENLVENTGNDGRCAYKPGWSDQVIYEAAMNAFPQAKLNSTNITNIRTGAWGLISSPKVKAHSAQITDLSKMIAVQAEQIEWLTSLVKQEPPSAVIAEQLPTTNNLFSGKDFV